MTALLAAGAPGRTQEPRTPPPPAVTAASAVPDDGDGPLRIDALVTDRRGRPVTSLRLADFALVENGVARPLASAEFRGLPPAAAIPASASDDLTSARQRGTRVFAFLLDEFHVAPGEAADRVRSALLKFVDERLEPQDLALVTRPLDDPASVRFTRDRAALRAAIAGFVGRQGDLAPRGPFEAQYIGRAPAAVIASRAQIVNAALRNQTLRLGDLAADRPILIVVSDGFPTDAPNPSGGRFDAQGVLRAASRSHLTIYAVRPGDGGTAATAAPAATGTIGWLAEQTGGRSFAGSVDPALDRIARDLAGYYALTVAMPPPDGKFHAFELRTVPAGLEIHTRPGYWAPFEGPRRGSIVMKPVVGRVLHRSALVETSATVLPDAAGRTRLVVAWEARAGSRAAVATVRARSTDGQELFSGRLVPARAAGGADSARFDVPPGRVEIDLDLFDAEGRIVDRDTRDIDVPDLVAERTARPRLFPQLLRARTVRDFEAIAGDPAAAPSATRRFSRGDRLLIRVPTFDASGAPIELSATILNVRAQPMREIDPLPSGAGAAQFALPLSWLGAGQYFIQIVGRTAAGATTERLAFTLAW